MRGDGTRLHQHLARFGHRRRPSPSFDDRWVRLHGSAVIIDTPDAIMACDFQPVRATLRGRDGARVRLRFAFAAPTRQRQLAAVQLHLHVEGGACLERVRVGRAGHTLALFDHPAACGPSALRLDTVDRPVIDGPVMLDAVVRFGGGGPRLVHLDSAALEWIG